MRVIRDRRKTASVFIRVLVTAFGLALLLAMPGTALALDQYNISDNATGGHCTLIGAWDSVSKTCTLTADPLAAQGILISSDGVTLDGAGHSLTGDGSGYSGYGVTVIGRANVAIKNLSIQDFQSGVLLSGSSGSNITNNAIGGNDQLYGEGILLYNSDGNDLTNNTIFNHSSAIKLSSSFRNYACANTTFDNAGFDIHLYGSGDNTFCGNNITSYDGSDEGAIQVNSSGGNTFKKNIITNHDIDGCGETSFAPPLDRWLSVYLVNTSNNRFYNNYFYGCKTIPKQYGGGANLFNLAAPVGGNYWERYDMPSEGCEDANPTDGFCDAPLSSPGNNFQDGLPLAGSPSIDKPALTLSRNNVYWSSYAAYQDRFLTVDWAIRNDGPGAAYGVKITGNANTNRVQSLTELPELGDIGVCSTGTFTMNFNIPAGAMAWSASLAGTAMDENGSTYRYP